MISRWIQHLKDERDIERFKQGFKGASWLLDRLDQILREEELKIETSDLSNRAYEVPNWPYVQAHKNGYRQCLYIIRKLIAREDNDERKLAGHSGQ